MYIYRHQELPGKATGPLHQSPWSLRFSEPAVEDSVTRDYYYYYDDYY